MTPEDDPARDAWLSQALRHAPDADAAPPAELSDAILRQARNAVKAPHTAAPVRANPLLRLWSWLARPAVAAGFATVMVATLVGVMWWDRPLDESLSRPEAPAAAPAPAPAAAPAPTPARDEAKAVARTEQEAPRTTAPPPPPAPKRERAATGRIVNAAPPAGGATAEPAPAREEAAEQRSAPAPAQALAKAAPAASLSLRRQEADAMTPAIDQPEHWTWQRSAGTQAMTPALQRWLTQLDRVARWRPAAGAAPAAADGNVLQLWRDGTLRTTITLGDDAVWLSPAGGAPVTAPLSSAAAASLKSTLIEATP